MELLDEYKNNGIIFKNMLKENLKMGILNPERDDKIKEMLKDLKKKEEKIEEIRKVFDREKEVVDELLVERQEYLKKLAEIKIKKGNLYKKCETIDNVVCRKLKEISLNENDIKEQRYIQIAKNTNLEVENVKNWINYFKYVVEYLKENNELHLINTRISELKQKFEKINNHFIIGIPDISIEGKSKEIKMKK